MINWSAGFQPAWTKSSFPPAGCRRSRCETEGLDLARMKTEQFDSDYYPPRARWWSGIFYPWFRLLRVLRLEQIHCPRGFNISQVILSLFVPGLSFITLGRRVLGLSVLAIYFLSLPVYFIRLGFPEGNFAYGLLLAAHATSIFYLLSHWIGEMELINKLGIAAAALLCVWLVIYLPAAAWLYHHVAVPLQVRGQVIVMRPHLASAEIRRGDRIMFRLNEAEIGQAHGGGGAVWVRAGVGWGPILALPGDQIVFSTNSYAVNGIWQTNLEHMPTGGEMTLATNVWFAWPEFAINSHGNVSEANISGLIMQLATISSTQMIGQPYPSWFWRKQKIP